MVLSSFSVLAGDVSYPYPMDSNDYHEQKREGNEPVQSNLAVVRNMLHFAGQNQTSTHQATSGGLDFDNLNLDTRATFANFDVNDSGDGNFQMLSLVVNGDITADTTLSFGLDQMRTTFEDRTGTSESNGYGVNGALHHRLNEHYGLGTFGYYTDLDFEGTNPNSYSYGVGLLFSTYHGFELLNVGTVTSFTYTDYDVDTNEYVMFQVTLDKQVSDEFTVFTFGGYTEGLEDFDDVDSSYLNGGFGIDAMFTEDLIGSVSYERTYSLDDYNDDIFHITLNYSF